MTKSTRESVRRSCGETQVTLDWPIEWKSWDELPRHTRESVRQCLDGAIDAIEQAAKP